MLDWARKVFGRDWVCREEGILFWRLIAGKNTSRKKGMEVKPTLDEHIITLKVLNCFSKRSLNL